MREQVVLARGVDARRRRSRARAGAAARRAPRCRGASTRLPPADRHRRRSARRCSNPLRPGDQHRDAHRRGQRSTRPMPPEQRYDRHREERPDRAQVARAHGVDRARERDIETGHRAPDHGRDGGDDTAPVARGRRSSAREPPRRTSRTSVTAAAPSASTQTPRPHDPRRRSGPAPPGCVAARVRMLVHSNGGPSGAATRRRERSVDARPGPRRRRLPATVTRAKRRRVGASRSAPQRRQVSRRRPPARSGSA